MRDGRRSDACSHVMIWLDRNELLRMDAASQNHSGVNCVCIVFLVGQIAWCQNAWTFRSLIVLPCIIMFAQRESRI
ncbi:hypothetical protein BV20DRAFT_732680 [Pilatotrama ljubarskyi]|nr:hypothetical protein BV20DRAFT_732680 [Pilatotrama ljubarskyi]